MDTPIDFGKDFLHTLYRERDAKKACAFLADDIVWITPSKILHLRTEKEIREFVASSIAADPQPYNVDVASIKSAPTSGDCSTIAYDVNLIPKREQDAVNLRVSLTIHRTNSGYELVFVGMSRQYERSDAEQMRGFMENLPSGLMVLAGFGANSFRELYVNSYFPAKLGYEEDEFYDRSEENPFFMIPYKEQKRMITLVNELSVLKRPRPISMQVTLVTAKGEELPFQVITKVAYKDKDGTRTILYLLYNDLTELMQEQERARKREKTREAKKRKAAQAETDELLQSDTRKLHEEAEEMQARAAAQLDDMDKLITAAKEAADAAEKEAKERADREIEKAREEAKAEADARIKEAEEKVSEADEKVKAAKESAEEAKEQASAEIEQIRQAAENDVAAAKTEVGAKLKAAEDQLHNLEEAKKSREKQYEDRILSLEWQVRDAEKTTKEKLSELRKELEAAAKAKAEEEKERAAAREKELQDALEEARAEAKGRQEGLMVQIHHLQDQITQRDLGLQKQDLDAQIASKEKDKSIQRLTYLLNGQMNAIQSLAAAAGKDTNLVRQQAIVERISKLAGDVPPMTEDLQKIAAMDPAQRSITNEEFTLSSCLNTVRKVIRPQCRERGIIFTCETNGTVPDKVIGSKDGLQLAFLCILENAVHGTAQGGRIRLSAEADRPVRGRAYFHFLISDTGAGIPEEKLPVLFDNPSGELSIARKVISAMGGSIQVRSSFGSGSRFEISVNMRIGK